MSSKTVVTLRSEAKQLGIVGYSKMKKQELEDAIAKGAKGSVPKKVSTKAEKAKKTLTKPDLIDAILKAHPSLVRTKLMKMKVADLRTTLLETGKVVTKFSSMQDLPRDVLETELRATRTTVAYLSGKLQALRGVKLSPGKKGDPLRLIVGRSRGHARGEKFEWTVASAADVSSKLELLVGNKWVVPAVLLPVYGVAEDLWENKDSLSGKELEDWGFDGLTVKFSLKNVDQEDAYQGPRFGGKLKK